MLRAAIPIAALAGCGYQPGSFRLGRETTLLATEVTTVGCLDIAISRLADHAESTVLAYRFGNRCGRPAPIDLQRVAVVGRFGDGREVALAPYDPRQELRPVSLDGRNTGREVIAYPTPRPAAQVCVDVASIAHARPARWLCFGNVWDVVAAERAEAAKAAPARAAGSEAP